MKPSFELKTDDLPTQKQQVHSNYGFVAIANKTEITIANNDNITCFVMTWNQQLSLNTMLHLMNGPVYRECDDCSGVMVTPDMGDRQGEPIMKSDDGIKISGDFEFIYILNEETEQQVNLNWNNIINLRDFLTDIDNTYRD